MDKRGTNRSQTPTANVRGLNGFQILKFLRAYLIGHVGPQCSRSNKKKLWNDKYSDTFSAILDEVRKSTIDSIPELIPDMYSLMM